MTRSLLLKVYLWFLLALVLTTASVAAFFLVFDDWPSRAGEQVIERVSNLRDVVQRQIAKGTPKDELDLLMQPIVDSFHATITVIDTSGKQHWRLTANKPEALPAPVRTDLVERMRTDGSAITFGNGREVTACVPMKLPDGDGVFYAQARAPRRAWQVEESRNRLVLGLGVILIVGFGLCFLLARSITSPLGAMARVAERFGEGDLGARMQLARSDELRRVSDSFNGMADRISRLLEDKRRLLTDISHELKTPLSRLRLSLELAKGGDAAQFIGKCDKQVEQIAALIDELLLYSRLEAQPYSAERKPVDLVALFAEIGSDPKVSREISPGTTFPLDHRLIARALGNVIENALTYAKSKVSLRAEVTEAQLVVTVSDDGPGISGSDRERVFEPFFRAADARAGGSGGHGLGLAIAKRCVEAHGGRIEVTGGSTFVISVPTKL